MNQPDLGNIFREEAGELLAALETALLALEQDPTNGDHLASAFRALHTLKGSGGMAGFQELVRFAHQLENLFDRLRKGEFAITSPMLTIALESKDHIQALIKSGPDGEMALADDSNLILGRLLLLLPASGGAPGKATTAAPSPGTPSSEANAATFWIRFQPPQDAVISGGNPLALLEELGEMGGIGIYCHTDKLPPLATLEPELIQLWWDVILNTTRDEAAVRDVFMFVDNGDNLAVTKIGSGRIRQSDLTNLCDRIKHSTTSDFAAIRGCLEAGVQKIVTEKLTKRKEGKETPVTDDSSSSIRVDSDRLDKLVDMVGELVIIQSRLTMSVNRVHDAGLTQIAEELERLSDTMRGNALRLRMIPIGTSFNTFQRLVRDIALKLDKDVTLVTEGAETEIDKTVIDRLKDPFLHILRNSLDHGIESREQRLASGKPQRGTVRIAAGNASGDVVITISDDGRGIDPAKVRARAIERGLITPEQELSVKEIYSLLFEPGFSTAEQVSDISGRGVGMDVVRKGIDALRGSIDIASELGRGTTFSIRLPLTLAIIDGIAVKIGNESFIVPIATVEACQERFVENHQVNEVDLIPRMGHMIPCISLRHLMRVQGEQPSYERVIIAKVDDTEVGLAVDKVVGRQQAVIKSLATVIRNANWVSGTTINGDGGISLILDVQQIVRHVVAKAGHHG